MYKRLTTALLLAITMTASAGMLSNLSVQEQQQPAPSSKQFVMPIAIQCDTKGAMSNVIGKKYNETPFTTGNGTMTVTGPQGGTLLPGIVKLWANPDTWTFSITIEDPNPRNDVMCLLTSGMELKPLKPKGDDL